MGDRPLVDRRTRRAFAGAAGGLVLLVLVWVLALHVGAAERADQAIFKGFYSLHTRPRLNSLANFVAQLCDPNPYVYLAAAPLLIALWRRRPRVLAGCVLILLGANTTTQLLKPLLAEPRAHSLLGDSTYVSPASWPSGHATAAMSLALCLVLAVPARLRPAVAALGAAFAVAVSYSFLSLGWHYPSDVLGGFLVAGSWSLLVVGVLYEAERRWPVARPGAVRSELNGTSGGARERISVRDALAPQAALVLGAGALGALLTIARPHSVVSYARGHELFVLGAVAIGMLALAVSSAITLATRR